MKKKILDPSPENIHNKYNKTPIKMETELFRLLIKKSGSIAILLTVLRERK